MFRYRDAWDQLKGFRHLCSADLKVEARRRKELEAEEARLKELEEMRSQARAEANMKAKIAESEGRLLCSKCQGDMLPNKDGVYEFENFRPGQRYSAGDHLVHCTVCTLYCTVYSAHYALHCTLYSVQCTC